MPPRGGVRRYPTDAAWRRGVAGGGARAAHAARPRSYARPRPYVALRGPVRLVVPATRPACAAASPAADGSPAAGHPRQGPRSSPVPVVPRGRFGRPAHDAAGAGGVVRHGGAFGGAAHRADGGGGRQRRPVAPAQPVHPAGRRRPVLPAPRASGRDHGCPHVPALQQMRGIRHGGQAPPHWESLPWTMGCWTVCPT